MKRFFFLGFLLALMLLSSAVSAEEHSSEKKVVYDLKSGDVQTLETYLISSIVRNSTYYHDHLEELHVKVVIHGESYGFFQKNQSDQKHIEIGKRFRSLSENYDVEFEVCEVGIKKRKISPESLYDFVKIAPSAAIALINAQNEGYAYLPVH